MTVSVEEKCDILWTLLHTQEDRLDIIWDEIKKMNARLALAERNITELQLQMNRISQQMDISPSPLERLQ